MKHRSVIAFVIVAAALFAAPQLSHDLQNLRSGLAARLRGELLQAFLSLHPEDGGAAPTARAARTLLASCTKVRTQAPAAKPKKDAPRAALQPRQEETSAGGPSVQLAMMAEPEDAPESWSAQAVPARPDAVGEAVADRAGTVATEVAMIIPPENGIEPKAFAAAAKAREGVALRRKDVEEFRRVAVIGARFEGRRLELQGPAGEALRKLSETLPGSFEFRYEGDGAKSKTFKVIKRAVEPGRPAANVMAPRATRLPGVIACAASLPPAASQEPPASE